METFDLNKFYEMWCKNSRETEFEMLLTAAREIFKGVQEEYFGHDELKNLSTERIYDLCKYLGWPFLNDGGIFEQIIKKAVNIVFKEYWD